MGGWVDGEPDRSQLTPEGFQPLTGSPAYPSQGKRGCAEGGTHTVPPRLMQGTESCSCSSLPSWGQPPLCFLCHVLCRRTTVLGREPWTRGNWFLRSHLPKNCGVGVLLPLGRTKGGIRSGRTSQSSTNHCQAQAGMGVTAVRDPGSLPASGMGFTLVPLCATHSPSHSSPSDIPSPSCSSW